MREFRQHGRTSERAISAADTSGDRVLAVLGLFTADEPTWTVDAAARRLGISKPTAYRYFKSLARAGLVAPASRARCPAVSG